ncbi:recQ4 helicase isoform X2 [Amblyomma americanum]
MNLNENVQQLKFIIKEWEKTFTAEHGRKPSADDIKNAPKNIAEAYTGYWKIKKKVPELKASVALDDGVWDSSLNKKRPPANENKKRPISSVYTSKIREKLLASFEVKSQPKEAFKSCGYRSKSLQDEPVCPKTEERREHFTSVSNEQQAKECTPTEQNITAAEDSAPTSPHKMASTSRTLYYKHSLDESWLSRNSIADDDEVFVSPPSSASHLPLTCRLSAYRGRFSEKGYVKAKVSMKNSSLNSSFSELIDDVFLKPMSPKTPAMEQPQTPVPSPQLSEIACEENSSCSCLVLPEAKTRNENNSNHHTQKLQHNFPHASKQETQVSKLDGCGDQPSQKVYEFEKEPVGELNSLKELAEEPHEKHNRKRRTRVDSTNSPTQSGDKQQKKAVKKPKVSNDSGCDEPRKRKKKCTKPSVTAQDAVLLDERPAVQPKKVGRPNVSRQARSKSLNENFVRINLKRKKFSRGHHKVNVRQLKFKQWKNKRNQTSWEGTTSTSDASKCFKCGEIGHWARSCPGSTSRLEVPCEPEVAHLPTLDEAAQMARGIKSLNRSESLTKLFCSENSYEQEDKVPAVVNESEFNLATHIKNSERTSVQPLLKADHGGKLPDTPKFVFEALYKMGFSDFRPGQEATIVRILSGLSTLLVSSTGSGKSLCYQLPAYLYAQKMECITLVVSPLISLMEDQVLTTQLKVHCILALTATATKSTCLSIAEHLQIDDITAGIIGTPSVPENLILSVSEDQYRDEALIELLKGTRFGSCESIIVYCTRREETERLASLIRTSLQHIAKEVDKEDTCKAKSRRSYLAWDAEAYHAGMTPFRRRSVQKKFMTGKLRVVVATVAFGMGIDKADIRAVIHYNMPKSFESYVQETGRAGRDGLTSHCHLFLEPEKKDQNELKRHIYANSVDRHVIRKLLKKVLAPLTKCKKSEDNTSTGFNMRSTYEIAIPIEAAVEELDLKEENILTLLCFLEFHPRKVVQLLNRVYATCTIKCYGGPQQLRSVASKNAVVAAAMALQKKINEEDCTNSLSFAVVDVAARMGWDSKLVKSDLKRLEWDNSMLHATGHSRKTGVIVEFSDLAFHLNVSASLTEEDCDELLDYLNERVQKQEKMDLARLRKVHEAFQSVSCQECTECANENASTDRSNALKKLIQDYFEEKPDLQHKDNEDTTPTEQCLGSLRQEIRSLVMQHRDHSFNGRAVARIFHGIESPCFPAKVWGRVHRFWRSFLDVDFNTILNIANKELLSLRS